MCVADVREVLPLCRTVFEAALAEPRQGLLLRSSKEWPQYVLAHATSERSTRGLDTLMLSVAPCSSKDE
eukprot:3377048-Pleurochrysis_carterae.AAC.1